MASGRMSLAQQIAQLEEATPIDYDPEDIQSRDMEVDSEDKTTGEASGAREHYIDVGLSTLRKLHDSISDPKYDGVRTSRKELMEDSDENVSEDGEDDMEAEEDDVERNDDPEASTEGSDQEDEGEDQSEEDEEHEQIQTKESLHTIEGTGLKGDAKLEDDMSLTMRKKREEDLVKGKAVMRQLSLWDTLLDARIRLQKSVTTANTLPPPSEIGDYLANPQCREAVTKMMDESLLLLDELFDIQEELLTKTETVTPPPRKRRKVEHREAAEDYSEDLIEATQAHVALEQAYHPKALQTIAKWSSKIQAVAPSLLLPSNRGAFSKNSQQVKSAVQLIDEALSDHGKLLAKTQVRRSKGARIGTLKEDDQDEESKEDPEIFDDTDFYQIMLRDVIDSRSGKGVQEDWMALQKQKKSKKKVDTKASKGRKLRYEVHEKLQNFMVPVPVARAWHEEQIDELFASLLGKGYEGFGNADSVVEENSNIGADDAVGAGFRVFG